jgi:hypothetical protein
MLGICQKIRASRGKKCDFGDESRLCGHSSAEMMSYVPKNDGSYCNQVISIVALIELPLLTGITLSVVTNSTFLMFQRDPRDSSMDQLANRTPPPNRFWFLTSFNNDTLSQALIDAPVIVYKHPSCCHERTASISQRALQHYLDSAKVPIQKGTVGFRKTLLMWQVALIDAPIISGVILLAVKNVRVLGGHVPELADAWVMDRKMKTILKAGGGKSVDGPQPPPFTGVHVKGGKAVSEPTAVTSGPAQAAPGVDSNPGKAGAGRVQMGLPQRSAFEAGRYSAEPDASSQLGDDARARPGNVSNRGAARGRGASSGDWRNERGPESSNSFASETRVGAYSRPESSMDGMVRGGGNAGRAQPERFEVDSGGDDSRQADGGGSVRPRESVRMRPGAEPYRPRVGTGSSVPASGDPISGAGAPPGSQDPRTHFSEPPSQQRLTVGGGAEGGYDGQWSFPSDQARGKEIERQATEQGPSYLQDRGPEAYGRELRHTGVSQEETPLTRGRPELDANARSTADVAGSSKSEKPANVGVNLLPAAAPVQNKSAAMKLLERRENDGAEGFRGGRGRGRGRGGRRRRFDDDDDDVGMTLEEWEAKKAGGKRQPDADEELARRMQEQFDLEEREAALGEFRWRYNDHRRFFSRAPDTVQSSERGKDCQSSWH